MASLNKSALSLGSVIPSFNLNSLGKLFPIFKTLVPLKMAFFTNVVDLQAALSACLTVRDWEVLFEAPFAGKIYLRDFRLFVTIIDHYRQKTKYTHTYIHKVALKTLYFKFV